MKVVTAPETYIKQPGDVFVFLAGGITNCSEWQKEVIRRLENANKLDSKLDHLVVFNPRRENFPIGDPKAADAQIKWEFNAIEQCDIFSMYFDDGPSDQPICMYELGRNILRMQQKFPASWTSRIVVTAHDGYKRYKDVVVQTQLATKNLISIMKNLDDHIADIISAYDIVSDSLDD